MTETYDPALHVIVPRDLLHKTLVLIKFHVRGGACIDIDDKLYNAVDIYSELSDTMITAAPQISVPQPITPEAARVSFTLER